MNAKLLPEPERWSERTGGTSTEDTIGGSLKRIRAATEPSTAAASRWARQAMAASPRPAAPVRIWSLAVVATILGGASVVAAGVAWRAVVHRAPAPTVGGEPTPAPRKHRGAVARQERPAAALETPLTAGETPPGGDMSPGGEPLPAMPTAPPPVPPLPAVLKSIRPAPRAPAPPETVTPVFEPAPLPAREAPDEAALVSRAFRRLRSDGDPRGALEALDEHERRFGSGALATEAALARAEALLLLHRGDEALPILLGMRDPRAGLTPEVRVTRAELLARAHRCAEATADFDQLLAPGGTPAVRERALYGRASCELQGAHPAEAIPDLDTYLAEYPDGRFAPTVRAALDRLRRL